jgi:hypothetical protein
VLSAIISDNSLPVAGDVTIQTDDLRLPYRTSSLIGKVCLITNSDQGKGIFFLKFDQFLHYQNMMPSYYLQTCIPKS